MRTLRISGLAATIAVYVLLVLALLPIIWMLRTSVEGESGLVTTLPLLWPTAPTLQSYVAIFNPEVLGKLWNSIVVAAGSTLLALAAGFPAAYALSRSGWPKQLDKLFLLFVLVLKLTPPIALAVPLYQVLRLFGLLDSLLGLILVYQVYALPFAIWMLLGFVRDVPLAYEEAAMLDGADLATRLRTIILPMMTPGLAATSVFLVVLSWNEFLYALLFIQSPSRFTLPTYIASLITEDNIFWGQLSAIGLVASLPVLVLVGFVQKALTRGFAGGIK
ncbi:MAG TPA: carbohydrate ABC transporter permease [Devosiaceae bacterium]